MSKFDYEKLESSKLYKHDYYHLTVDGKIEVLNLESTNVSFHIDNLERCGNIFLFIYMKL